MPAKTSQPQDEAALRDGLRRYRAPSTAIKTGCAGFLERATFVDLAARAGMSKKILVVDNELRSRDIIAYFFREENYEVEEAGDGASALKLLENQSFDLLICDIVMPRLSGFELINQIKSGSLSTSIILMTGHPYLLKEKGLGDIPCFTKPFNMYDLLHKVRELVGQ